MSKYALITGASSGLGAEFAKLFAKDNINVVLVARNKEKLTKLANELNKQYGIQSKVIAKDLSLMNEIDELYSELKLNNIKITYLVNNAGFGDFNAFTDTTYERLNEMMDLNMKALTKLCKLFIPNMVENKFGKVLNVASTAAFQPGPYMAVYYASKAYVLNFSEAIYKELINENVSVTTLCPGATKTEFFNAADMNNVKLVKGKKLPTAESVAKTGYKAMQKGKLTVIPGFMNNLLTFTIRFTPRKWVLYVVEYIQGNKK